MKGFIMNKQAPKVLDKSFLRVFKETTKDTRY